LPTYIFMCQSICVSISTPYSLAIPVLAPLPPAPMNIVDVAPPRLAKLPVEAQLGVGMNVPSSAPPQRVGPERPSARVLSLDNMITGCDQPQGAGVDTAAGEFPSLGSSCHHLGTCKPCGFFHRAGCAKGAECQYCHLCGPDEKKKRQREKREMLRAVAAGLC